MECVVDTNALVYDMIEDSELHGRASAILDNADRTIVPTVVVEELVHALKQLEIDENAIKDKIEEILTSERMELLPIDSYNIKEAVTLLKKHSVSYRRFNDKLILSVAKNERLPLVTFDRELIAQCKKENVEVLG